MGAEAMVKADLKGERPVLLSYCKIIEGQRG
jgi:hypothetical protein